MHAMDADFSAVQGLRFAVDTAEDMQSLRAVAEQLQDVHATAQAVAELLRMGTAKTQ